MAVAAGADDAVRVVGQALDPLGVGPVAQDVLVVAGHHIVDNDHVVIAAADQLVVVKLQTSHRVPASAPKGGGFLQVKITNDKG